MAKYQRGDKVWWWSRQGGRDKQTKAIFVRYDKDGFPDQDAILAIRIHNYTHLFRWPLRLMRPVA